MNEENGYQSYLDEDMIEIDLREYMHIIWSKKWIIILLVIIALVASYFLSKQMTKIYSTSTLIMINNENNSSSLFENQLDLNLTGNNNIESYTYIIKSRKILNDVIHDLNLKNKEDDLIKAKALENNITISRRGETGLLEITVDYSDPVKAKNIADKIVENFTKEIQNINRADLKSASEFVNTQLVAVKNNLENTEEEILQFKKDNNIIQPEEQSKNQLSQLTRLETGLIESQLKLAEARATLEEINNYLQDQNENMISSKTISNNPIITKARNDLSSLKIELAGLLEKYTEQHPKVIEIKTKIKEIEKMMENEVQQIVSSKVESTNPLYMDLINNKINIENQILAAQIQIDSYKKQIKNIEGQLDNIPEKNLELSRLSREAKVTENIYLMLKERQEEINIQTAMKSSNIVMVDSPIVNEDPIRPNLQLNMAISFVLALFISIFIIFLIEFMDDTIKEEKDIEKAIGVNVIGIIPDINDIEEHK